MTHHLLLADPDTAKDVLTFVGRATRITDEGVRLQAANGVLALTTAVLAPQGLFDQTPTILAMRIVHADPELECDVVVDRLTKTDDADRLTLPETGLSPAWAGVAPPRSAGTPEGAPAASRSAPGAQGGGAAGGGAGGKAAGLDRAD
ncbi:hypothetical protein, partial [Microbacterium sp.]|uniref:hypothetical protein n=1 Tax=Microbacterium sp. TaxID=51671 RepID=UPI003A8ED3DF